jgi:hypothetical protein
MKSLLIAAAVATAALISVPAPSQAESFSVRIGNGHHHRHVDRGWHRGWHAHAGCRTVITKTWRNGHRVTVRKKICR